MRSLAAISPPHAAARRQPAIAVPVAPPAPFTRRTVGTSFPTALANSPESVG
jgi:hypothetical protein